MSFWGKYFDADFFAGVRRGGDSRLHQIGVGFRKFGGAVCTERNYCRPPVRELQLRTMLVFMVQIPILQHFQKIKARFQRGTRHKPPDFFLCEFRFGGSVPITEKKVLVTSFNVAGKVTDQWRTKLWSRPSVSISANNREVSVEHRVLWFVKSSRLNSSLCSVSRKTI